MGAWSPDTLTLRQSPAAPHSRARWVLWPAWKYRVHAPVVPDDDLNIFQRAVLRLCRAGVGRSDDLTGLLHLDDPELCEEILGELRELDLIDNDHMITELGAEALNTGELDPLDTVVTYVFQDPFTGQLWPQAIDRLAPADVQWSGRGQATIRFGDAGDDRRTHGCLTVWPAAGAASHPLDVVEILDAVRASQRHVDGSGTGARREGLAPSEQMIRRVSFIDRAPEPVFLLSFLYVARSRKEGPDTVPWQARDPLWDRPSVMLRQLVAARCEDDETVRVAVDRLMGVEKADAMRQLAEADDAARQQITAELERKFTLRLHEDEELRKLLVEMETNYQLGRSGRGGSSFENAIRSAFRIFEDAFRRMIHRYLGADDRRLLAAKDEDDDKRALIKALLRETAASLGLDCPGKVAGLAGNLRKLNRAVRETDKADFRSVFAVAVLSTQGHEQHPLRRFANQSPRLFEELLDMADMRNPSSHGPIGSPHRDEVEWCREVVFALLPALIQSTTGQES